MRTMHRIGTILAVLAAAVALPGALQAQDCNGNGTLDLLDVQPTVRFDAARDYVIATLPRNFVFGDVNGDGSIDCVSTTNTTAIAVALNDGRGGLAKGLTYTIGAVAYGIALADFDGDTDLDVVTVNRTSNSASLLRNVGGGVMQWFGTLSYVLTPKMISLALAKLDADADVDIALLFDDRIIILLNDGTADFFSQGQTIQGIGTTASAVAAGDMDNDTDLDLVVTDKSAERIYVLRNNGNATFAAPANYTTGTDPNALVLADLNGDNWRDVATANQTGDNVTIRLNTADGAATLGAAATIVVGDQPSGIDAADLDGDSDRELIVCNTRDDTIKVLSNNGAGSFAVSATRLTGDVSVSIAAVDLDNDLDRDIAVLGAGGTVTVHGNKGGGVFPADPAYLMLAANHFTLAAGDLDGDLDSDLVAANQATDVVTILRNDGGLLGTIGSYAVSAEPFGVALADLDHDLDLDIAAAGLDGGSLTVLFNDAAAAFPSSATYPIGISAAGVAAADFDQDGSVDLAVTDPGAYDSGCTCYTGPGVLKILRNSGGGSFVDFGSYPAMNGAGPTAVGRFNHDAAPDLVVAGLSGGETWVFMNAGNGTFGAGVHYAPGLEAFDVAVADLNSDGRDDFAVARLDRVGISDGVAVYFNQGNGTFGAPLTLFTGGGTVNIDAADMDGDGDIDLLAGNVYTDSPSMLINRGDGSFDPAVNLISADGCAGVAWIDLDRDGDREIAAMSLSTGKLVFHHGLITPATDTDVNGNHTPDACETVGDMNCDGTQNQFDINPFLVALISPTQYEHDFPDCDRLHADCNGDGTANQFDIQGFLELLAGP